MSKIPVAVLGATGVVGQHYVALLQDHPWFELAFLGGRTAGSYADEVAGRWQPDSPIPQGLQTNPNEELDGCPIIFSALPDAIPFPINEGATVISHSPCHRLDPQVPLVIPEVNAHKLSTSTLIAKPNCALQAFVIALTPLHRRFGVKKLIINSLQAMSGAGLSGLSACEIHDTILPHIRGEETKIARETRIIWEAPELEISVQCSRIPVLHGHLADVAVAFEVTPKLEEIIQCWEEFPSLPLPSAPKKTITYVESLSTRHDCRRERGMGISVSRLRHCPVLDFRFCALAHNAIRGGAGGGLLIAETIIHGQTERKFSTARAELSLP